AEARQWLSELNLPNSCLKSYGSGYVVTVDLTPLQKMVQDIDGLGAPGKDSKLEMDNAKYQAWQSGFKAQEENLKTTLQTLTQKYSNANSLYDNLVKVLSSTISSSLETAKSFLQG
ncbi:SPI-1 type III secretion system needle tip complex protein SipD, partial [Salmonella enterica]|nr:SPI-1 type III secretion system needle tip complex protein SipD [Salmonella enterica]